MKFQYINWVFLLSLPASLCSIKPINIFNNNTEDCRTIIDSAKIFVQTNDFAFNLKPTIEDSERNLRLDKWLQSLSFKNLTCLLDNSDISIKVLGFVYAASFHKDSLFKSYSDLLTDTTTVQMFRADGKTSPKIKLGELLSKWAQNIKEVNDNFARRPEIEKTVSAFIRQYSTYPNTYKPLSFPYYSMGSDDKGLKDYKIHHNYEIKNNEGVNVNVVSAFVLEKNLKINIIEKDSTTYSYSYPPKLGYWLKEFGKKLNKGDSITLNLK